MERVRPRNINIPNIYINIYITNTDMFSFLTIHNAPESLLPLTHVIMSGAADFDIEKADYLFGLFKREIWIYYRYVFHTYKTTYSTYLLI